MSRSKVATSQAWYVPCVPCAYHQTSELLVEPEVAEAALVKAGGDLDEAFHLLLQHASVP